MEKSKRSDEQVAGGSILRNWKDEKHKTNAVVKASLLLRCGDVETNPGPHGREGKIFC